MDVAFLEKAITAAAELRATLIRGAKNEGDAIAIATAFILEAERIYRQLGGERLVAAQFYHVADEATNKMAPKGDDHGL